ncbi:MAG TPA: flagellar motor protein [Stellaceae bacterium]|nr:flagellar motor protein [Stellaceae bacterium]
MDILAVVGLILAFASVILSMALDGGSLLALLQFPAFMIVVGGTIGAIMLQTPPRVFLRAFRIVLWAFMPPANEGVQIISWILDWAQIARREGVLALEPIAKDMEDPFLKEGLNLVIDGIPPATVRAILETKLHSHEEHEMAAARVFEQMGGYAPTIGIIGAVLGLITTMAHLDDPASLGRGIATAFVATVYGVGSANLLYLPLANKLRTVIRHSMRREEVIVEGLLGIATAEPRLHLGMRLASYFHDGEVEPANNGPGDSGIGSDDSGSEQEFRESPADQRQSA